MFNIYVISPLRSDGKTFISAGIAATMQSLGYKTAIFKPFQLGGIEKNGFIQSKDVTFIKSLDPYINTKLSYVLKTDEEPLIASEIENEPINTDLILKEFQKIASASECTIIDGSSGLLSPICAEIQTADLIKQLQIPVLIVTKPNKDAVNSTLQTIYTAQEKGLLVRGVIINDIKENDKNLITSLSRIIEEYTSVKVLGLVSHLKDCNAPEEIISSVLNGIDIESVFNVKIEKLELG